MPFLLQNMFVYFVFYRRCVFLVLLVVVKDYWCGNNKNNNYYYLSLLSNEVLETFFDYPLNSTCTRKTERCRTLQKCTFFLLSNLLVHHNCHSPPCWVQVESHNCRGCAPRAREWRLSCCPQGQAHRSRSCRPRSLTANGSTLRPCGSPWWWHLELVRRQCKPLDRWLKCQPSCPDSHILSAKTKQAWITLQYKSVKSNH